MKRGFVARAKDIEKISIESVKKGWLFSRPNAGMVMHHRNDGEMTFLFRNKRDVIIGLHELERFFGEQLKVTLDTASLQKGLRKYEKIRAGKRPE